MAGKATSLWLFALAIPWLALSVGCSDVVSTANNQSPPNPIPTISSLSPSTAAAGSAALTLSIVGTNFVPGALVNFGGATFSTTFVNSTQLTVAISAATIRMAGTVGVTVVNPAPGGGTSNDLTFTITNPPNPIPTISSLSPSTAAAGSAAFTLSIVGTNFVPGALVNFGGATFSTTFVNSTQLTVAISAATIAMAGTVGVTVVNPAPGGGTSNDLNFTITNPTNPIPAISSLSPNGVEVGSAAFTLSIVGTNFVPGALVNFGGTTFSTTFVNSTQLTVAISATTIAMAGTVGVTVVNPAPGGGTSNDVNFTITNPPNPYSLYFLDPSGAAVGGPGFTLVVSGSDFLASSIVQWNGSNRPTTFVDSTQLSAQIPASDISATGIAAVTVFTPAPGGGTSNSLTFTIVTGGVSPQSIAVDPTGRFAYVADSDSDDVSMYTIDGTTGALTPIGLIPAGSYPVSIAAHPAGNFVYVANSTIVTGTSTVSIYTINPATGALTSIGLPVATGDDLAHAVAVDPTGKFAYVANAGGDLLGSTFCGSVTTFDIDATTGALTSMGTVLAPAVPSPGSCTPWSVAVDPTGKFAYVANMDGFTPTSISMYSIDATTGVLTSLGLIATADRAVSVAVAPTGNFVYAADGGEMGNAPPGVNVSMYTINTSTGVLTATGTITAGSSPVSIAIDPFGKFAYVVNSASNNVSMYTINGTTGALTSIGTIAAGLSPSSITIHPSGKFAYVTNSGSNTVSMYTIDPATGALSLIGTVGT